MYNVSKVISTHKQKTTQQSGNKYYNVHRVRVHVNIKSTALKKKKKNSNNIFTFIKYIDRLLDILILK